MRLLRATIEDFGLIAHAQVEFSPALTVFSGETGSGKTMLLGALRFALGDRADHEMVRRGAMRARVTLEVAHDAELLEQLGVAGFPLDADDDLLIVREVNGAGRAQGRLNGMPISASQLRALAGSLVEIIGQHDATRLSAPAFALELLDRFGGDDVVAQRNRISRGHADLARARKELDELTAAEGLALAQLEFARFAVDEIDTARVIDGEDERLRERREVLANGERIVTALGRAAAALEAEAGVADGLGAACASLAGIARFRLVFGEFAAALGVLQSDVNELSARITRERETVEGDATELDLVLNRLELLDRLKRKYGGSIAAIAATRQELSAFMVSEAERNTRIAQQKQRIASLSCELSENAVRLTSMRASAARELERRVEAELHALFMPTARFEVALDPLDVIGPTGAERIELRLSPNPGEPARSILRSASGGELARVLLALIVALADRRERTALVFDEIDAGIGGATAVAVGARIGQLARTTQIVVVTHLAPIASWANRHYALRKHEIHGATLITLKTLQARHARLEEIARMLSGTIDSVALEHAATLVAGTGLA